MLASIVAIAAGAALGALLRWLLAVQLNALWPALPPGTLLANLLGGYLIGVALAFFAGHPSIPPAWRLFVVTGFLGALTTFSTFSAEIVHRLQEGQIGWALAGAAAHMLGSVAMTLLGIATVGAWRARDLAGG